MRKPIPATMFLLAATLFYSGCPAPAPNANVATNRPANAANTNLGATSATGEAGVRDALTRLETALAANDVAALDKTTVPKVAAGVTRHGGDRACQIARLAEIVTPDGAGVQLRAMISL